jgi:ferritin-like metal-binding protein YciE
VAYQAQDTLDQARDKAGQIASDVKDPAQQAIDQVTQNFDLNEQIAQRPLLALGAALAAGYVLGNMGGGSQREYQYGGPAMTRTASYGYDRNAFAMQQAQRYESEERQGMIGRVGSKLFSSLSSLEDLFQEQLMDLYDAEHQILKALPKMAEAATSPDLKQAFQLHLQQTQGHVRRLQQVFEQLGASPRGKMCAAMQGLVAEAEELMSMRADPTVMDAGLIASAQRVEHYEMAGYGCLRTWARQLGYGQAVSLLQQTLDEEEQTDKKLSQIAERAINVKAAGS